MAHDPLTAGLDLIAVGIDKLFPDPIKKEEVKLELFKQQQAGNLGEIEIRMSAILAEAKSSDPWTSRARPSFLYVMYIMILMSIPMGIVSVFSPRTALAIAEGMRAWLSAIPDMLWGVFGSGYLGYSVLRSVWDKKRKEEV